MASLERFHRDAQDLLDKDPLGVTRRAGELHDRAVELLHNDVTAVKCYPYHVNFTPANIDGHLAYVKDMIIAQLSVKTEEQKVCRVCSFILSDLYTVNHKKRDIIFLTITVASLNRFL